LFGIWKGVGMGKVANWGLIFGGAVIVKKKKVKITEW
jgi:hypothetical protein